MCSFDKPLVVQGNGTLLLDVHLPSHKEARNDIAVFAELVKSPEHIHTYQISSLSLWNAASIGWTSEMVIRCLKKWSRYEIPYNVISQIDDSLSRWGKLILIPHPEAEPDIPISRLRLQVEDPIIFEELEHRKKLRKWLVPDGKYFSIEVMHRGTAKAELANIGFPVTDLVPLKNGLPLELSLNTHCRDGTALSLRDYQYNALNSFLAAGKPGTGFGTVVMPCGSGKTMVGMAVMASLQQQTLILTTNIAAVHQWRNELLDKTDLASADIAEYSGEKKEIGPVTVATYQILIWRKEKEGTYPHFDLIRKHPWGLIIYDEVHLLPAPIFRVTSEIQAVRRLGLTATLIREDGAERELFSLVGPKRFDIPWKELESKGWISQAQCQEIRINLPHQQRIAYAMADNRRKIRIASDNPRKLEITRQLVANRHNDHILVIGQYISQLEEAARLLKAPLITGRTPNAEREVIYDDFRTGRVRVIVVSKVANFAIDLPCASVAIQLSGTYGSRQEEAQRLGRILRPKKQNSWFYSLVSRGTVEEDYALNRQRFLAEQGYRYSIDIWENE